MTEKIKTMAKAMSVLCASILIAGCACLPAEEPVKATRTVKPAPTGCSQLIIPTGDIRSGVLLVEKESPSEVSLNQPFTYKIYVKNLTDCEVINVKVWDNVPAGLQVVSTSPQAATSGNNLEWNLGTLAAGEVKEIAVEAVAKSEGTFTHCAQASYEQQLCATVAVVSPQLTVKKTAPAEVLLCDPIPVTIVVCNPGSGVTQDVKVTETLPAGLTTDAGERTVSFAVGDLAPGDCREFTYMAKATRTGAFESAASATAAGNLSADSGTATVVRQPVLAITKNATEKQFPGRNINYDITVENRGDAVASDLVITDALPAGTTFVSASGGGQLSGSQVVWNAGSLAPNAKKSVSLTVRVDSVGTIKNVAEAKAVCASAVSASASTLVEGVPAILLEVIDVEDPIEIGNNETYVIRVTNQGTADDDNIKIVCTLEDSQEYVGSEGATRATARGNVITFAPLPSLAPKDAATWKVVVKARKAGDVRFKVSMTSNMLQRPVEETESTHQY